MVTSNDFAVLATVLQSADDLYSLSRLARYNTRRRIKDESVAEHSFHTSVIVGLLHEHYEFNREHAMCMATVHDLAESDISDIPHDVKNSSPEFKAMIDRIEHEVFKRKWPTFYQWFKELSCGDSVEARIVHLADVISVMQYVASEESLGNSTLADIKENASRRYLRLLETLENAKRK